MKKTLLVVTAGALIFSGCAKTSNSLVGYGKPNYRGTLKAATPGLTNPVGIAAMAPTEVLGSIKANQNKTAFENMMQNGGALGVIQQKMKESGVQNGQIGTVQLANVSDSEQVDDPIAKQEEIEPKNDRVGSKVGGFLGDVASGIATGALDVMKNRLFR